ncbi:MAG: hypothetical protein M3R36_18860 [Bacteroidota bacterium]|nr:hypothetical protein [Bacteroidota bacterium]
MVTEPKLSILTFPQKLEAGKLHLNILLIPRNINPLLPMDASDNLPPPVTILPVFADTACAFKAMIINSLDGLPLVANVSMQQTAVLLDPITSSRDIWEALKQQIKVTDDLIIDDDETRKFENSAKASIDAYNTVKNVSIRKYLPETYRNAFNFTKPRTKYAVTGDEYQCAVNNHAEPSDKKTNREKISWGKAVALCLRNPLLAEKAGLIYHATIDLPAGTFDEGGWLYIAFDSQCAFAAIAPDLIKQYAARIPALKDISERTLFAAVQFPVTSGAVISEAGYDEIIREAIVYDDGFAKIVHANQPVNHYLLKENDSSNPPLKDVGIRIGWDDEQLTIWQNRQMKQKEENTDLKVDAPLGVFSYCIDAKKTTDQKWFSQNSIMAPGDIIVQQGNIKIVSKDQKLELGSEVHATSHGRSRDEGFWLPMYFVNWLGNSLAIPDKDAEEINQLTAANTEATENKYTSPSGYDSTILTPAQINDKIEDYKKNNTINTIPKKTFNPYIQVPDHAVSLIYGNTYNFRIRLMDISGGAAPLSKDPIHGAQKPVAELHFKRHTGAGPLNILNVQDTLNSVNPLQDVPDVSVIEKIVDINNPVLTIERPKLGYPAVVFTGKYQNPDAVTRLKAILQNLPANVQKTAVNIGLPDPDVKSFKVRVEINSLEMDNALSATGKESYVKLYEKTFSFNNDVDQAFDLKIIYRNYNQLPFNGSFKEEEAADELLLPKGRQIRATFIPLVDMANNIYADESIAFGKTVIFTAFKKSDNETSLLSPIDEGVKAMYLQPESDGHVPPAIQSEQKQSVSSSTPVELSRIADALNVSATNLTLEGQKGERVQFGCSKLMRHSLAPDSSSISFTSLAEIFNHWVVAVQYTLNRDWSWDGLEVESFSVFRKMRFESQLKYEPEELAGTINVSRTANINSLTGAQRDHTMLIFLDAFDPKKKNNVFPEEIFLSYRLVPNLKQGMGNVPGVNPVAVHLPVTIIPQQVPELISAGIALSPYIKDEEKYTYTDTRQKFLWLEMKESLKDPNDNYYVRVTANAPDPMLCLVDDSIMFNIPQEPPLNVNPEKIRIIIPGMDNDFAGMGAMQEMIEEQKADARFYMVPIPPGLHASSDELFGFFTYEIRVGHKKELWSTTQARYGRPLKVNGVQHPAPALMCNASRRKYKPFPSLPVINEIAVTAPFANAVLNGKNVAAMPPQTSLWCFLYAQVRQADGKSYRNILLDSREMNYTPAKFQKDEGNRYGGTAFRQNEISDMLSKIGLPVSSSLSVLCVEMFPLENRWRMLNRHDLFGVANNQFEEPNNAEGERDLQNNYNPLVEGLGRFRIYRTSALIATENICCDDC